LSLALPGWLVIIHGANEDVCVNGVHGVHHVSSVSNEAC
jgi:hypothetical protein